MEGGLLEVQRGLEPRRLTAHSQLGDPLAGSYSRRWYLTLAFGIWISRTFEALWIYKDKRPSEYGTNAHMSLGGISYLFDDLPGLRCWSEAIHRGLPV